MAETTYPMTATTIEEMGWHEVPTLDPKMRRFEKIGGESLEYIIEPTATEMSNERLMYQTGMSDGYFWGERQARGHRSYQDEHASKQNATIDGLIADLARAYKQRDRNNLVSAVIIAALILLQVFGG